MTPDAYAILLSGLLALVAYVLWVTQRLRRSRRVLAIIAVVAFLTSMVLNYIRVENVVSSITDDGSGWWQNDNDDGVPPGAS